MTNRNKLVGFYNCCYQNSTYVYSAAARSTGDNSEGGEKLDDFSHLCQITARQIMNLQCHRKIIFAWILIAQRVISIKNSILCNRAIEMLMSNRDGRRNFCWWIDLNQSTIPENPSKNSMVRRKCCETTFKCIKKKRNSHKRNDRWVVLLHMLRANRRWTNQNYHEPKSNECLLIS